MNAHSDPLDRVRRDLTDIPDLYALLPDYATTPHPDTEQPPANLDVVHYLDTRTKDADPTRSDADQDRRKWTWRDRTDRIVTEPAQPRLGVIPQLHAWTLHICAQLCDQQATHIPPGQHPCQGFVITTGPHTGTSSCTGDPDDTSHNHQPTITSTTSYLLEHLDWAADQPWFEQLADDLHTLRRNLRATTHTSDGPPLECLNPECGWPIREMDKGTWYRCEGCGKTWSRLELHKMAERRRPRPLSECAKAVGISVRTLRYAIAAGDLKHLGRDGGARLYDVQDCAAIAARIRLQQQQRRPRQQKVDA